MSVIDLAIEARDRIGTRASRRMRRSGRVPAVLYGAGKGTVSLSLDANDLGKRLESPSFASRVLTLTLDDGKEQAVIRAIQRHPANARRILHVDFQRIDENQAIQLHVPLDFINEDQAPGKRAGGVISHMLIEVEVSCLPRDLPESIPVDMSGLALGDILHLSGLTLPEGVVLTALAHGVDQPVASVSTPRGTMEEEDEAEQEADATEEGGEEPGQAGDG